LRGSKALIPSGAAEIGAQQKNNRFVWSNPSGTGQPVTTGTMCQVQIVTERKQLIELIVPWTRKLLADK
jgi:hypothetical protein